MSGGGDEIGLREASTVLGLHYMTVYRYVRTGKLAARREGGDWMVRRRDVEALGRERPGPGERGRKGRPRHEARVRRLVATLLAGDEAGAWAVIEEALVSGATARAIDVELMGAAMRGVGERWERGAASVADEHRASVIAHRLVGRAGAHVSRRGRRRGTIVLGAPAGEMHSLPSALLADVLRAEGFEVHDLGANVPTEDFLAFVASVAPAWAVGVVVTTSPPARALIPLVSELRRRLPVPVVVGGAAAITNDLRLPAGVAVSRSTEDAATLLAGAGRDGHSAGEDARRGPASRR
jgi:excisionase family DNA binding protein